MSLVSSFLRKTIFFFLIYSTLFFLVFASEGSETKKLTLFILYTLSFLILRMKSSITVLLLMSSALYLLVEEAFEVLK